MFSISSQTVTDDPWGCVANWAMPQRHMSAQIWGEGEGKMTAEYGVRGSQVRGRKDDHQVYSDRLTL